MEYDLRRTLFQKYRRDFCLDRKNVHIQEATRHLYCISTSDARMTFMDYERRYAVDLTPTPCSVAVAQALQGLEFDEAMEHIVRAVLNLYDTPIPTIEESFPPQAAASAVSEPAPEPSSEAATYADTQTQDCWM